MTAKLDKALGGYRVWVDGNVAYTFSAQKAAANTFEDMRYLIWHETHETLDDYDQAILKKICKKP